MRITRSKADILNAAIDMFSSSGYAECTMRELAKRAGIQPASLYYHFDSKDHLLDAMFDHFMALDVQYRRPGPDLSELARMQDVRQMLNALVFHYPDTEEFQVSIKILRIALAHQFENRRAGEIAKLVCFDQGLRGREQLLRQLAETGAFEPFDAYALAYIITSHSMMLYMEHRDTPISEFIRLYNEGMARMTHAIAPLIRRRAQ